MASKQYGTTLWGAELLRVLEQKTDAGRLGRGKTYANTDKVYDVVVKDSHIKAKVAGNYSPYYSTSMDFNAFSPDEIEVIKTILEEHPLVLASVTNGRLPEDFLAYLKEANISLFDDFKMSCSCPDFWGDYACKHIAGLYYVAVSQMDKNPFILFSLRGFDLIDVYDIEHEINIEYPLSLISHNEDEKWQDIRHVDEFEIVKLQDNASFILSILSDNPPFAPIDYHEVLEEFYKKVPRALAQNISPMQNPDMEDIERLFQNATFEFDLEYGIYGSYFRVVNPLFRNSKVLFTEFDIRLSGKTLQLSTTLLFRLFLSFKEGKGSTSYRFLFYLFRVAYLMIESKSFIPAVIDEEKRFSIVYKVLSSVPEVRQQLNVLAKQTPKMVLYKKDYLDPMSSVQAMLCAIVSDFVKGMAFSHKKQKNNPPKISSSFFHAEAFEVKGFEEENIATAVYNYFSIFDIMKSQYNYKIYIDKIDDYLLSIKVQDDSKEYYLKESLTVLLKMEVLKFVSFLHTYLPEAKELLKQDVLVLTKAKLETFLLKTATIISSLGIDIVLPKELKNLLRPKLTLKVKSKSKNLKSFFDLQSMLEYDWQIAIGEETISVSEFEKLVQSGKELIEFKDNFVLVSAQTAKNIFSQVNQKKAQSSFEMLHATLNGEAFLSKELEAYIDELFSPKKIPVPTTLQAELRPYQERGFSWNINNLLNSFGTILADDMGLGKTIQAICAILHLKENNFIKNRVLIVVPTSLIYNWENELKRFAPSLDYTTYHGMNRELKEADVLITTYDIVRRDLAKLKKEKIDCLIIDEAQKIKNTNTETSKAIKSLKAKYKMALSGTPVENNLSELWSIFDFALPKYLKSLKDFQKYYAKDIEIQKDPYKTEKLKNITAPFMLRRLKTDKNIAPDLPDKIIVDEYSTMTKEQAGLYQSVIDESFEMMEDEGSTGSLVLKLIISLKQICNHPRNFDKTSPIDPALSGKAQQLLTLLETILKRNEKVLIFTQYVEMGEILVKMIEDVLLTTPLFLKGSLSTKKRNELVESFQNDPKHKIFILSLKAGGVGLNLTAANHVVHYDLWFNPAVENQATDRAFRIGQKRNVSVYRFITKDSFEEKIDKMIKAKQALSELSVSIGENWLGDMSKDELRELFSS